MKILAIADVHDTPAADKRMLFKVGEAAVKWQPDVIVSLGDFATFDSRLRASKEKFYTFEQELASAEAAVQTLLQPIEGYNTLQRIAHKKMYQPLVHFCLGNHDQFSEVERMLEKYGSVTGFRKHAEFAGVYFSHYFEKGRSGSACFSAAENLANTGVSCISGHAHTRDFAETTRCDGKRITALVCPPLTNAEPDWAGQGGRKWSRAGVTLLQAEEGEILNFVWRDYND